ncbi:NAD(P)H-hydrate dehydratase [Salinithrix halophila]|uniref:Bifunctional NAD(P)H-hydrate repair enzyme n=1 Tax=Salinithrix halophila TaxID=1485204 RepID=A0ABV8JDD7_9BACL
MYLYTAQEMRDLDRYAIEQVGIPGSVLMENAGRAAAEELLRRLPGEQSAVVVAGSGNNGGDGFVIARLLSSAGWKVTVWMAGNEEKMSPEARLFHRVCSNLDLQMERWSSGRGEELSESLRRADAVVDALLGTGVKGDLRSPYRELVERINQEHSGLVLAVDVPSGVQSDTGAISSEAVRADVTVTFAGPKWCHYLRPAAEYAGELVIADIGIPPAVAGRRPAAALLNDPAMWGKHLSPRSKWSHKGSYGHLLILGGAQGMLGAAAMSEAAAYRTGAGMVTLGVPIGQEKVMASRVTEALVWGWPDRGEGGFTAEFPPDWEQRVKRFQAIAVGPGLGRFEGEREWLQKLLKTERPLVLDADALNILAEDPSVLKGRNHPTVVTPHPGEMARLVGSSVKSVEASRQRVAREWAEAHQVTVVLKGTYTIIASPDGSQRVNTTGSPALAKAGSGDVLTGILGALLVQGIPPTDAASAAVWLHGEAGQLAVKASAHSTIATDVIARIGDAIHQVH